METTTYEPAAIDHNGLHHGGAAAAPEFTGAPMASTVTPDGAIAAAATSPSDEPADLFWRQALGGTDGSLNWHKPPVPARQEFIQRCEELLHRGESNLQSRELPLNALHLFWKFLTGPRGAQVELEKLCLAIDPKIQEIQSELSATEKEWATAMSEAGLPHIAENPAMVSPATGSQQDILIHPATVESAVLNSVPGIQELAGQHGVEPPEEERQSVLHVAGNCLLDILTSLMSGFMVAVCLGTLVGLVKLSDMDSGEHTGRMLLAGLLGFVIVRVTGKLYYNVTGSLARLREPQPWTVSDSGNCARHRGAWIIGFFVLVALAIWVAEMTAEATGIRLLYLQATRDAFSRQSDSAPPVYIYFVIGLIMSGFYLMFKASQAWKEAEVHLRRAWLVYKQGEWLERVRLSAPVRQAFLSAYRAQTLSRDLQLLRTLRDAARAAAVGETDAFHHHFDRLIAILEPLPDNGASPAGRPAPGARWKFPWEANSGRGR